MMEIEKEMVEELKKQNKILEKVFSSLETIGNNLRR